MNIKNGQLEKEMDEEEPPQIRNMYENEDV